MKYELTELFFGDPAVVMYVKAQENPIPLHWNAGDSITNHFQCNYWGKRGASRAVLARELNLDEIINIKENSNVEIEVQVQGMTCMFNQKSYATRQLLYVPRSPNEN